jgi:hypothetical protein
MADSLALTPRIFIAAVYPEERQRAHAERWLGLLAMRSDGPPLTWSAAIGLVSVPVLLNLRLLVPDMGGLVRAFNGAFTPEPGEEPNEEEPEVHEP